MTLARVRTDYPADGVVSHFAEEGVDFGEVRLDSFVIDGEIFRSTS